ncbi:hypothetical protein BpHYR1_027798 [Brachionus plicatilis]|uniref:Uncharacterized protein n=1 Tax=Brachionus plicatilis TaxID=10195 RepID=A0A3M7PEK1_BRAPC|nr:hypothetical protein BpHYR1_027798 [Brachionus plicatilis]
MIDVSFPLIRNNVEKLKISLNICLKKEFKPTNNPYPNMFIYPPYVKNENNNLFSPEFFLNNKTDIHYKKKN